MEVSLVILIVIAVIALGAIAAAVVFYLKWKNGGSGTASASASVGAAGGVSISNPEQLYTALQSAHPKVMQRFTDGSIYFAQANDIPLSAILVDSTGKFSSSSPMYAVAAANAPDNATYVVERVGWANVSRLIVSAGATPAYGITVFRIKNVTKDWSVPDGSEVLKWIGFYPVMNSIAGSNTMDAKGKESNSWWAVPRGADNNPVAPYALWKRSYALGRLASNLTTIRSDISAVASSTQGRVLSVPYTTLADDSYAIDGVVWWYAGPFATPLGSGVLAWGDAQVTAMMN